MEQRTVHPSGVGVSRAQRRLLLMAGALAHCRAMPNQGSES
jgi:hypothetical protein